MNKSFTFYSSNNIFRLVTAWLLLATFFLSAQTTHTLDLTTSGTYTVPQGVTSLTVEAWGGGGGGGRTGSVATGGGGGGAYAKDDIMVSPNREISYVIGKGGSGSSEVTSKDGGNTWFFTDKTLLAQGGAGVAYKQANGAAGGQASTSIGFTKYNGGNGGSAAQVIAIWNSGGGGGAATATTNGGNGGAPNGGSSASPGGNGGDGKAIIGTGESGKNYGGGGAGSTGVIRSGGKGAPGIIRLSFIKPSIIINPSAITICKGNSVALTASSAGAYSYSWSNGAENGSTVTVSPESTTTYTVTGTASNGAGGTFTHTQTVTVNVNSNATSTASVPSSTPTLCINTLLTPITHTTTGAIGIGVPIGLPTGITASWLNNKITISGTPTSAGTFNYSIPLTGGCGTVTATGKIIVNPNLPASVIIASSMATTICAGTSVTFTATPVNGGTAPFYQWKVDGVNVGTNSSSFTTTTLANNDKVTVVMTSNASPCSTGSPATSNELIMMVNPLPAKVTVTGNGQICSGLDAVFTITGTPGTIITYNINSGTNNNITLPSSGSTEVKVSAATTDQVLNIVSVSNGNCVNDTPYATTVIVGAVSTYAGGKWDMGVPNNNGLSAIILSGNYNTTKGNIYACNCTVKSRATLTIATNTEMIVLNNITNEGTIIVRSDGNLKQLNDDAVNTGNIIVRREHEWTEKRLEYNFTSSPVKNQNMKLIFGNNAGNSQFVTVLKESNNTFVNAGAADWLKPARGFAVKEPKVSYAENIAEYNGPANNGRISIDVTRSADNRGWNLIGNPYPSNLDLKQLYEDNKTVIGEEFKFWDNKVNNTYTQFHGGYNGYSYAVYNAVTSEDGFGVEAPGNDAGNNTDGEDNSPGTNAGDRVPFRVVNVAQAFMVRAITNGKVNYKNAYRSTSNKNTTFFGKNTTSQDASFRIKLVTPANIVFTQGIVYFEGGNNAFGIEDSKHPAPSSSDAFYSFVDDNKVIINGRSIFSQNDVIKLGTQNFEPGTYKIKAVDQKGVFANGQNIYIKDNILNVIANLSESPYEFTSTSGAFTNRFEIVYKPESTTLGTSFVSKANIEIFRDGAEFVIRASEKKIKEIELFDLSGRLITKISVDSKEVRINSNRLSEGVYILKSIMKDGETLLKKIRKL